MKTKPLLASLPVYFQESQQSTSNHRKNAVKLTKLLDACSQDTTLQHDFHAEMARMINRILAVKKVETAGNRVMKFIETFLTYAKEKKDQEAHKDEHVFDDEESVDPLNQLCVFLVRHLLQGAESKEKNVRFRTSQLINLFVRHVTDMEYMCRVCTHCARSELFDELRDALLGRVVDKEATVRVQAVQALSYVMVSIVWTFMRGSRTWTTTRRNGRIWPLL
jgi:condensin complex subunit 3